MCSLGICLDSCAIETHQMFSFLKKRKNYLSLKRERVGMAQVQKETTSSEGLY